MKYKALIFDIDGTLLDTESCVLISLQHTLYRATGKMYKKEDLYFALGIPGEDALKQLGIPNVKYVMNIWEEYYKQYSFMTKNFPGMYETLDKLNSKNITLGIVTSKTRKEYKNDFEPHPFSNFFPISICADDTLLHKPNPEPLLSALEKLKVNPYEAIYIGDSCYDMECAKKANVAGALALWGCRLPDNISATWKLTSPPDIFSILE
ncbi:HAD superfamily hydrolase (TIGR01549 family) [Mobilisporobacter senegalensis]|uniref:HAD superfamily hydrolase (TIGR01549 family) n=1 Tax=Mobilisporobacter senegalensis TaxID=1329262 RepID=A0A3N1X598_9FIRM|nr:HAD family hydrolase [Mobilisporobacter senegalensis]ROR21946.1 HAD superfamily hydrolase (TIGR01549 family) [Mobilisporobacter senegalensis]